MWQRGEQQDSSNLLALGCQRNKWPYTFPKEAYNIIANVTGQQPRLMYSPNENTLPVLEHYQSWFLAKRRRNRTAPPIAVETAGWVWQPCVALLLSCPMFAPQSPCSPLHAALLSETTLSVSLTGKSLCVPQPRMLWGRDMNPRSGVEW